MTRREFIKSIIGTGACTGFLSSNSLNPLESISLASASSTNKRLSSKDKHIFFEKEAMFYEKLKENAIRCMLCPKKCEVGDRERGYCGVRENRKGAYYTFVYGNPCSINPDPIEKGPFFHFLPGSWTLSIATAGCNLNCKFCQNWEISQSRPEETDNQPLPPADVITRAKECECKTIAYTYSEPVVFYEYMLDTAKLSKKADIKSVVISAGFINPEPLKLLCKYVDAVKIDLKSFRNEYYNKICNGELQPILNALKILKISGVWYEIVYLVVTSLNDSDEEIRDTARWVYDNLGPDVPLHFSRFFPMYQLKSLPPTSVERVTTARKIAMDVGLAGTPKIRHIVRSCDILKLKIYAKRFSFAN